MFRPKIIKAILENPKRFLLQFMCVILSSQVTLDIYLQKISMNKLWCIPSGILAIFLISNLWEFMKSE